jgi:putative FmdB family regulatory protein
MPFYAFQCEECGQTFDIRATIQEKEAGLTPECPHCKSIHSRQVMTAGIALHGSAAFESTRPSSCPPFSGPGCCG